MLRFWSWWRNLSVARKLYLVVGTMAVLVASELVVLRFSVNTLSALRALVAGEGTWSKAQKDAVHSLLRYAVTRKEEEYREFLRYLEVQEGDHHVRIALESGNPDYEKLRADLARGKFHPADMDAVIRLLEYGKNVDYIRRANEAWREGDRLIEELRSTAAGFHRSVQSKRVTDRDVTEFMSYLVTVNDGLTVQEETFSNLLGEGSRWLESLIFSLLLGAVLFVEGIGLTLTFLTGRRISKDLKLITETAQNIGQGQLSNRLQVRSTDELGVLSKTINEMGDMLQSSYRNLEARVAERTAELNTALNSRDEFLSIASHELRTPLSAINIQLHLLSRTTKSLENHPGFVKVQELATNSIRQARRLSHLIDELMDLARLRSGRLEIRPEPCNLVELVRDAVAQLSLDAVRAKSSIEIQAPTEIQGEFDPTRSVQIVTNLVSNAIKYASGQPILVSLSVKDSQSEIRVIDRGPGISKQDRDRIFERFERGREHHGVAGLGLGLYITRQIVLAHGGQISVESVPGNGACFQVTLPLKGKRA